MNYTTRNKEGLYKRSDPPLGKRSWRIIIADDEALPAELLRRMLMRLGHTVIASAQNGVEALELTREHQPDLVIMDLRMPVMDGWTAMAELTRELLTPVVVVSALDDHESLMQAVAAGASAFLTKPVRERELERALELAMARCADLQEIRQLHETHQQLVKAAERATVASFAQGLTHEINNALTPIIANAQMIALAGQDPESQARAQQIMEHARRIAGWTASFCQVATAQSEENLAFSFNGIVRDTFELYADQFHRSSIQVSYVLDELLPVMHGYPSQIQKVWLNLIQNAVEAMRSGGTLQATSHYLPDKGAVLATLTDSGVGISREHLPHVFAPGYTTKTMDAQGNGFGWGLFTVQEIIHAHGGAIEITSPANEQGQGTTIRFVLPLKGVAET
ncbi:MAG TPA: response regulator [Anaerolineae bacterium]|nr:response regulator [Anaerolineae bacterium]